MKCYAGNFNYMLPANKHEQPHVEIASKLKHIRGSIKRVSLYRIADTLQFCAHSPNSSSSDSMDSSERLLFSAAMAFRFAFSRVK